MESLSNLTTKAFKVDGFCDNGSHKAYLCLSSCIAIIIIILSETSENYDYFVGCTAPTDIYKS